MTKGHKLKNVVTTFSGFSATARRGGGQKRSGSVKVGFNNRSEEAIGTAHDLWTAYREGAFDHSPRPWLGWLMLLQDCEKSRSTVDVDEPHPTLTVEKMTLLEK